ncbi:MAG: PD-(D/E)XK nuclease family protein [Planctomycetota bacterium]|jgi:hypothetical protein
MADTHTTQTSDPDRFLESYEQRPWLRVLDIAEFDFCPRAGMLARLNADAESAQDHEGQLPRLGYLPRFDLAEIRQSLDRVSHEILESLWLVGGQAVLTVVLHYLVGSFFALLAIASLPYSVRCLLSQIRDFLRLLHCLRIARTTRADEPPLPLDEVVPVHWWSLLNAGFTPVEYEEAHRHEGLAVAGRPWRVLHRGSLRIPVFRKRIGEPELHHQHYVRMAAYCCLVEECELAEVPYGIVLFGEGYHGVAIPALSRYRAQFEKSLESAREHVERCSDTAELRLLDPPSSSRCIGCHWGCPEVCTPDDVVRNNTLPESERGLFTRGLDRKRYASPCGNLFHWVPPHAKAKELGLLD